MAPYDDWNKLDDEEDEELQDTSVESSCGHVRLFVSTHTILVIQVL